MFSPFGSTLGAGTHFYGNTPRYCQETHQVLSVDLGRDGSIGIATRYGLDGPGIESW